jgi:hypothetical protein
LARQAAKGEFRDPSIFPPPYQRLWAMRVLMPTFGDWLSVVTETATQPKHKPTLFKFSGVNYSLLTLL